MTVFTVEDAKKNLDKMIEQVMNDAEPAIVRTNSGDEVVLLSREEFESWNETVYLLSSPANAAHLKESVGEAEAGRVEEKELIDA